MNKVPETRIESSELGLECSSILKRLAQLMKTHLRLKCGRSRSPGIATNAGNVIRLNVPKTSKSPSMPDVNTEERRYYVCQ